VTGMKEADQFKSVMAALDKAKFMTIAQLAEATAIARPRLHRIVAELCALGKLRITYAGKAWVVYKI
jgi:DNA-binding IclR family transcriptional regulator